MATQTELVQSKNDQQHQESPTAKVPLIKVRPRVDLFESDDAWLLRAAMPGVDEHNVDVSLEKDVMTIKGKSTLEEPDGFQRQYGEFGIYEYERSFRLPDDIDRDGIDASITHGMLMVRIPKAKEALPQKITVKGA